MSTVPLSRMVDAVNQFEEARWPPERIAMSPASRPHSAPAALAQSGRRRRFGLLGLAALVLSGCSLAMPFRENPDAPAQAKAGPAIAAITEAQVGGDRAARSRFWEGTRLVERSLRQQPGFLGHSMRRDLLGNRVWTMTVWQSEADLLRFVKSDAHREAIRIGREAVVTGRFARVPLAPGETSLPWAKALEALQNGRNLYE